MRILLLALFLQVLFGEAHAIPKKRENHSNETAGSTQSPKVPIFPLNNTILHPRIKPPAPIGPAAPPGNPPFVDASLQFGKLIDDAPRPATVPKPARADTGPLPHGIVPLGNDEDSQERRGDNGDLRTTDPLHSTTTSASVKLPTSNPTDEPPSNQQPPPVATVQPSNAATTGASKFPVSPVLQTTPTTSIPQQRQPEPAVGQASWNTFGSTAKVPALINTGTNVPSLSSISIPTTSASLRPSVITSSSSSQTVTRVPVNQSQGFKPSKKVIPGRQECPSPPTNVRVVPRCNFSVERGKALDMFNGHFGLSICEMAASTIGQCQITCANVQECRAVHFCLRCVGHNCRLLKEAKNGPANLTLINRYDYVDYSEKGSCAV